MEVAGEKSIPQFCSLEAAFRPPVLRKEQEGGNGAMSIFSRKRDDVPEMRVEGEEVTVETRPDTSEFDDPDPRVPEATESRRVKLPKTKWF